MSNSKPSPPQADALAKKLKDSLSNRRFQPWKIVLGALFLSVVFLALLAWWMYPRPRLGPLHIVALDAVGTEDDTLKARAQLVVPADEEAARALSGYTIVFHEQRIVPRPNENPRELVVKSDERGQASVDWPALKKPLDVFLVKSIDPDKRYLQTDRGQIFMWPKDAPLLIVDVDETLLADEVDAKASAAFAKAAKAGWRVVYLTVAGSETHQFRKTRGWVSRHQAKLPNGPVLGRGDWPSEDTLDKARSTALKALKASFHGKMCAVVKDADSARVSREAGAETIVIGNDAAPAWAKVAGLRK